MSDERFEQLIDELIEMGVAFCLIMAAISFVLLAGINSYRWWVS